MDGRGFKALLRHLGRTQVEFAGEIGVSLRTVHYWASGGPPSEIAYLLDLMVVRELPFGVGNADDTNAMKRTLETELDRLYEAAEAGRRFEFIDTVEAWIEARRAASQKSNS